MCHWRIKSISLKMEPLASMVVFIVSGGYPGEYETGFKIDIERRPSSAI